MKQEPIVVEKLIDAPSDRVWKAITDKAEMKNWYFDIKEFKPEPGFEFQFTGTGKDGTVFVHHCRVMEVIPGKKLSYTWSYEFDPNSTLVTFELFPEAGKTRLKLTHEGIDNFLPDNKDLQKQNFVEGWTHIIGKSLPNYLEKEKVS